MFEEFGPQTLPSPPAGAMEQAITRGRKIRRQRRAGIASGVALGAALIGGFVLVNPVHSDSGLVVPAKTSPPTTAPPDYSPIPVNPAASGKSAGLDFGVLTKVTTAGGVVTLHVNRAHFYMGAEAKAQNHGEIPLDGWVSKDTDGKKEFTFILDPKASIQAEGSLQTDQEGTDQRVTLTRAQFLRNIDQLTVHYQKNFTDPVPPYVWLRHTGGPDGPVTALADQFTP